jgi:hypothetical protein
MKLETLIKNEDGSVKFQASLNQAEVTTLLQYSINNLMAMGFVFDTQLEVKDDDNTTNRFKAPTVPTGTLN